VLSFHRENECEVAVTDGNENNTKIGAIERTLASGVDWRYCPYGSGDYYEFTAEDLLMIALHIQRMIQEEYGQR
jgi:hypothetical protein